MMIALIIHGGTSRRITSLADAGGRALARSTRVRAAFNGRSHWTRRARFVCFNFGLTDCWCAGAMCVGVRARLSRACIGLRTTGSARFNRDAFKPRRAYRVDALNLNQLWSALSRSDPPRFVYSGGTCSLSATYYCRTRPCGDKN